MEERQGKEGRRERRRDRMGWYIGKEEESVLKKSEGACLATRKKNIFLGLYLRKTYGFMKITSKEIFIIFLSILS